VGDEADDAWHLDPGEYIGLVHQSLRVALLLGDRTPVGVETDADSARSVIS
jgi:hypothetical protein